MAEGLLLAGNHSKLILSFERSECNVHKIMEILNIKDPHSEKAP